MKAEAVAIELTKFSASDLKACIDNYRESKSGMFENMRYDSKTMKLILQFYNSKIDLNSGFIDLDEVYLKLLFTLVGDQLLQLTDINQGLRNTEAEFIRRYHSYTHNTKNALESFYNTVQKSIQSKEQKEQEKITTSIENNNSSSILTTRNRDENHSVANSTINSALATPNNEPSVNNSTFLSSNESYQSIYNFFREHKTGTIYTSLGATGLLLGMYS